MASEATTQATSRGGRGGGSGGCGGRGGGPDDEDDLDDEALEGDWVTYMDGARWRRWGKNERELEEKEGVLGMGRAKMEKVVVEERVVLKKVVEEERVADELLIKLTLHIVVTAKLKDPVISVPMSHSNKVDIGSNVPFQFCGMLESLEFDTGRFLQLRVEEYFGNFEATASHVHHLKRLSISKPMLPEGYQCLHDLTGKVARFHVYKLQ
nr:hypothetical protein CFP56_63169 [Quercus suber]